MNIKKLIIVFLTFVSFKNVYGETLQYDAHKLAKEAAKSSCLNLAKINLHPKDFSSVVVHTEAKVKGVILDQYEGYQILVVYPYRRDGLVFLCTFRDYRQGAKLQLLNFGHADLAKNTDKDVTEVKLLW